MAYDNSGTLGKNKRKEKENHPSHTGSCIIDGEQYWISAWVKENKETGEKFFSLAFRAKDESARKEQSADFDAEDGIPF
jgi:hypothetical protein